MSHWKTIFPLFLLVCSLGLPMLVSADAAATNPLQPEPLQALIQEMLANNNELSALDQKVAALKEEARAAGAWEDPRLGFGLLNLPVDSFRFNQEPMTQKQITLAQRVPWFGKLSLKAQRATLNAAFLESTLNARRSMLIQDLTDAYYELGFVSVSLEINQRVADHLEQIVHVAESRYASGKGLQQDVLQAQVEQSRLTEQDNLLRRQRRTLEDRINGLLNRESFGAVAAPAPDGLPGLRSTLPDWQALALEHNPDLRTRRIEIDQADVDIELSRKAYYPDPDFVLAYGQRDADPNGLDRADFLSASVVFNLPVWSRQKQTPRHEAALKQRQAAQAQHRNLVAQLPHQVDAVAAELDQLSLNYHLYQEALLIQAGQWAEAASLAYEVGKANFNTMISARLQELALERQAKQYLYQYYRKLASLDQLLGNRLNDPGPGGAAGPEAGVYPQTNTQPFKKES